jgi:hypothetical protein
MKHRKSLDSEVVPLHLIFDYPVHWSKFKVLRDLLQNFYDAVGHREWHRRFSWQCEDGRLQLNAQDVGFSHDWLLHIGASTKREAIGEYAGYFGEGFKIAALCALRDHDWQIELASRDWRLQVTTEPVRVDGRNLTSLAYRIWHDEPRREDTALWIEPFRATDRDTVECAFLSFFAESNPLFGEPVWNSPEGAVFLRSKHPKPPGFPQTSEARGSGIVFAGYQALGSLELPLVVCSHRIRWNDRERSNFFRMDVVRVVEDIAARLPPEAAMRVLPYFRRWWSQYPRRRYDFDSWHRVVGTLTHQVSRSPEHAEQWRERFPHLLCAAPIKRADIAARNRRRQALDWLGRERRKYRLVQEGFATLGYGSLETACEAADGFSVARPPTEHERRLIGLLETFVERVFPGWFGAAPLPPCRVLTHDQSVWMGMAVSQPCREPVKNPRGWMIRHRLSSVALMPGLFRAERGPEALSTYLHELAHCFGGDQSGSFAQALTGMLEVVLHHPEDLMTFRQTWDAACRIDSA